MKKLIILSLLVLSVPQWAHAKDYSTIKEIRKALLAAAPHWPWNDTSLNEAATFYQQRGLTAGISPTDPKFFYKASNPCAYSEPATDALCNPPAATATAAAPAPAAEPAPASVPESAPAPEVATTPLPTPVEPAPEAVAAAPAPAPEAPKEEPVAVAAPEAIQPEPAPAVGEAAPAPAPTPEPVAPIVTVEDMGLPAIVVVTEPPKNTNPVPAVTRSRGNPRASGRALVASRRYNAQPYGFRRRIGGIRLLPDEPREPASIEEEAIVQNPPVESGITPLPEAGTPNARSL